jgi:hypothetical protein
MISVARRGAVAEPAPTTPGVQTCDQHCPTRLVVRGAEPRAPPSSFWPDHDRRRRSRRRSAWAKRSLPHRTHFRGIPATSDVPVLEGTPTPQTAADCRRRHACSLTASLAGRLRVPGVYKCDGSCSTARARGAIREYSPGRGTHDLVAAFTARDPWSGRRLWALLTTHALLPYRAAPSRIRPARVGTASEPTSRVAASSPRGAVPQSSQSGA